MKKKWIVIPSLLVVVAAVAAITMPMWRPMLGRLGPVPKVDAAMRSQTIDTLLARLNAHYVFPEKAKAIEASVRQRQREGKYDAITDGEQLARQLSEDLASIAHDHHLDVMFEPGIAPPDMVGPPPDTLEKWEQEAPLLPRLMRHVSKLCVEKTDHLSPKIGYLQLSCFPPHFLMAQSYAKAMDKLADTEGLIVDLRQNGGGDPRAAALLVSYFVDQRTRLNDMWERDTNITTQQWTVDRLDGKRYGGRKPVVILAGPGTMSAGEDFVYTMQAMKRAMVIGERTWGGAHPGRGFRLGDHFLAFIPTARPINPITQSNWEGSGVTPDIASTQDKALAVAQELVQRRLKEAAPVVAARP